MQNNKRKKRQIKVGKTYLVDTFAGVRVKIKATRKEVCPFTKEDVWWGVLIDEEDAKALQKACVPYSKINVDESIIFDWQIVKSIRTPKKGNVEQNERSNRKPKSKTRRRSNSVRKGST